MGICLALVCRPNAVLNVISSFAMISLRKRELVALLCMCSCRHVGFSVKRLSLSQCRGLVRDCGISWSFRITFSSEATKSIGVVS